MKIKPMCFLLPKGTSKRLRTLARDDESQSDVLLRAIKGLEGSPSPLVTKMPDDQVGAILKRFDDVAATLEQMAKRLAMVESRGETAVKADELQTVVSVPVSKTETSVEETPQASVSAAAPDKKSSRVDYPPEVRKRAVDMRREGKKPADILAAIHKECGHAPDGRNLQKRLNTWEKELAQEAVPPTSAVVVQVVPTPAPVDAGEVTPPVDAATAMPDKKPLRAIYSPEVRRMAVAMRKKGEGSDSIILAIHKECGYAPGKNNLPKMLDSWERDLDVASESVAQEMVAPVIATEAISAVVTQNEAAPASSNAEAASPEARSAPATPDKRIQRNYPPDVRQRAVDMRRKGKSPDAIISFIQKKCGYAPDRKLLTSYLNRWENPR